ncbi:GntR family transcriptional regulator [Ruegeria sp. EL01]|jgi:DNA-binding GntR family transcriptional regulator|uniref:GntR family transcriptional regulator n=1 Tax=Ruegeria sp. EL01 TaxID=2107578 RepID=UPI000EA82937|nr:GntR family transcriptional regulator [Ruegeria sp. EL01]
MAEIPTPGEKGRRRGSGVQFVYETLRDEIIDLGLPPGSPIDEVKLSERFSMSRTPIREALVRLASEGLVTTLPNRASIVTPIDFLNLHTFFDAITLMYRVTTRLAAEYRTDQDLADIRALQTEFAAAATKGEVLTMIAKNAALHTAIAQAGRNPYYESLTSRLLNEGQRIMRPYYSSFGDRLPERYASEHDDIINAIEARDIALSDQLASAHAEQIVQNIRDLISTDRRQSIDL